MSKAMDVFSNTLRPEEVINQDLFKRNRLALALYPILRQPIKHRRRCRKRGYLKDPGPVGQAMRLAGKIFKPGKVNIADFELSDELINTFDNLRLYANNRLADVGTELGKLKDVPILGLELGR